MCKSVEQQQTPNLRLLGAQTQTRLRTLQDLD